MYKHTHIYILRPFNYCFPTPTELEKKTLRQESNFKSIDFSVFVSKPE